MERLWNDETVSRFFNEAGGKANIGEIYNCSVRLRLKVLNLEKVNKDFLSSLPLVKDVVYCGNEVQLLIGINAVQLAKECKKVFEKK